MSKIYDALHRASEGEPEDGRRRPSGRDVPEFIDPPELNREEVAPVEMPLSTESPFALELDQLRSNLDRVLPGNRPQSLMVVGAVPGEGASTVATSFAQVLSEDPHLRVVYLDADLRNRDDRLVEPVAEGKGFASLLAGRLPFMDALRPTLFPRLDVLPSEGLHPSPYRSTSGEKIAEIVAEAKRRYHRVLIDGAPVLSAPETPVMASEVDGVILVVRAGKEKREVILEAVDGLKKRNARILGVVINRQKYFVPGFLYRRI